MEITQAMNTEQTTIFKENFEQNKNSNLMSVLE